MARSVLRVVVVTPGAFQRGRTASQAAFAAAGHANVGARLLLDPRWSVARPGSRQIGFEPRKALIVEGRLDARE